jgi:hypothetical protein
MLKVSIMSIIRPRTLASVAGIGSLLFALGCGSSQKASTSAISYVTLHGGVYHGQRWQMYAFVDEDASPKGTICLEIAPPEQPRSSKRGEACQFNKSSGAGYNYYATSLWAKKSLATYGPLPDDARYVRVSTRETLPTYVLPRQGGLPQGRYWIQVVSSTWPKGDPNAGQAVSPRPLNSQKRSIPFKGFR